MPQRRKQVGRNEHAPRVAEALARLETATDVSRFLDEILTPAERHDVELRWRLLELLKEGVPQREIADQLGISLCKITRGSRIFKDPRSIIPRLLD